MDKYSAAPLEDTDKFCVFVTGTDIVIGVFYSTFERAEAEAKRLNAMAFNHEADKRSRLTDQPGLVLHWDDNLELWFFNFNGRRDNRFGTLAAAVRCGHKLTGFVR